jgi:hypothetical protein
MSFARPDPIYAISWYCRIREFFFVLISVYSRRLWPGPGLGLYRLLRSLPLACAGCGRRNAGYRRYQALATLAVIGTAERLR